VLAEQEASGESLAGFAWRHGFKVQRLHWWRSRIGDWEPAAEEARLVPALIEATPKQAPRHISDDFCAKLPPR